MEANNAHIRKKHSRGQANYSEQDFGSICRKKLRRNKPTMPSPTRKPQVASQLACRAGFDPRNLLDDHRAKNTAFFARIFSWQSKTRLVRYHSTKPKAIIEQCEMHNVPLDAPKKVQASPEGASLEI